MPVRPQATALSRLVSLAFKRIQDRYVIHGLVLGMALVVVWASAAWGHQGPAGLDSSTLSDLRSTWDKPADVIVARVITSTQSAAAGVDAPAQALASHGEAPVATAVPAPAPAKPAPDLKRYLVQDGDNPFDLAQTFGISEETLLAANGLGPDSVLQIGEKLLVPPVSGVVVSTQAGDTVSHIASQWKLDPAKLIAVNRLSAGADALLPGEPLVLPDAAPPVQIYPLQPAQQDSAQVRSSQPKAQAAPVSPHTTVVQSPKIGTAVRRVSGNNFPWGQCTWWAAQSRPDIGSVVIGNAASWLYSARAAGLPTGTVPRAGAIVVYQPGAQGAAWTGHVAYVTSVSPDGVHFTISEMNFPFWGRVTSRSSWTGVGVAFIY